MNREQRSSGASVAPAIPATSIVLVGPPGAGKTTVGRALAQHLGLGFVDTDDVIAAEHGPIRAIFADRGEPFFREVEAQAVVETLDGPARVIALGGGAPTTERVRAALAGHTVIALDVDAEHVARRIVDDGERPLLAGGGLEAWLRLASSRRGVYRQVADAVVTTTGLSVAQVLERVVREVELGAAMRSDGRKG